MAIFIPTEKIGRSGLSDIDVNPAVYLQLKKQLDDGKNVPFNHEQLLRAFGKFLRDTKGDWSKEDIRSLGNLDAFAKKYVQDVSVYVRNLQKTSSAAPSQKYKNVQKILAEKNVTPLAAHNTPVNLQSNELTGDQKLERAVDIADMAWDILRIATSANVAQAVILVMTARALLPSATDIAFKGTDILLEKYKQRADTDEEKDLCIDGLEEIIEATDPKAFGEKIEALLDDENSLSLHHRLSGLKQEHTPKSRLTHYGKMLCERENTKRKPKDITAPNDIKKTIGLPFAIPKAPTPTQAFFDAIHGKDKTDNS